MQMFKIKKLIINDEKENIESLKFGKTELAIVEAKISDY